MNDQTGLPVEEILREAIDHVAREEYLAGLNLLTDLYADPSSAPPRGLSYLGLCTALVEKRVDDAIELCYRALQEEPGHAVHFVNFARVYLAGGDRRKAVDVCEAGLRAIPNDASLLALREELGVRSRPPVPFLSRENPINQTLGRARHARKSHEDETRDPDVDR